MLRASRLARLRSTAMSKRALASGGGDDKPKKLWGGAFGVATDPMMEVFNNSLPFDKKLWAADVCGSQAYAKALERCGQLDAAQAADMARGLSLTRAEWAAGAFEEVDGDEDIHTANERRLGEHIGGDTAGRLHTGRSRNDQVATDLRLWLRGGALAGHPFFGPGDRDLLAADLKFGGGPTPNSVDSVSDRDFAIEFCQWAALTGVHLSRWAEDLIVYGTREFAFVKFGEAYSTGSSLMPQKRNPDALELLRGKSARLMGHQAALTALLASTPAAYNKDLQEDKEPVFDAGAR
ncbi:argininosuccinate lyase [Aureococcus anophagefferens]|nr:argininosuccinate lyase [Aureococcus anophagefferens]